MGSFVSFSHTVHFTATAFCSRRVLYIIILFFRHFGEPLRIEWWWGVCAALDVCCERGTLVRNVSRSNTHRESRVFFIFFFFLFFSQTTHTHAHHAHTRFDCENCFHTELRRRYISNYIYAFRQYIGICIYTACNSCGLDKISAESFCRWCFRHPNIDLFPRGVF